MRRAAAIPAILLLFASLVGAGGILLGGCGGDKGTGPEGPSVTLTSPTDGATVSGAVTIRATGLRCDVVRFTVDGASIGSDDSSPYEISWNTGTVDNGSHTLKATAEGGGGTAADEISVTVANEAGEIIVTVAPTQATVELGATSQFSATVTGTQNHGVTWSVDGGASKGTITAAGLYTAPAGLPSPATATVRATSQADPGRSAAATVTLVDPGSGEQVTAAEKTLAQQVFGAAHEATELGTDGVATLAEAIWGASELAGAATMTGTLTQAGPGSDVWTYSAQPRDKLVLVYAGGPTVEFAVASLDGYTDGGWEEFVDQHDVDFTAKIAGQFDVRIRSRSVFVGGAEVPYSWKLEWTRSVEGSAVYQGETMSVSIADAGEQQGYNEPGYVGLETEHRVQGQASSSSSQITVDEYFWTSYVHNSNVGHIVRNWQMTVNSSATLGSDSYRYDTASARWEAGTLLSDSARINEVRQPDYWVVMGSFLKNNEQLGQVQFNGPVVAETNGPDLVLKLFTGEEVLLHTLVPNPGE